MNSSSTAHPVVEASRLQKTYDGRAIVDEIDFTVTSGECFGILGPNGAGKTTTMRMLLGVTPPSGGSLRVLGHNIPEEACAMRRRVGVVPQSDNLDPDFTVIENLIVYANYFGIPSAEIRQRLPELLSFASLESRGEASIQTLSGGMKRRLTLARALVNNPALLILDEPTTGLDPQARQLLWQRLRRLQHDGRTLILTTHYMEEAERLCDRLVILDNGRILVGGSPRELVAKEIEPQVVEVYGPGAETWKTTIADHRADRTERVGESIFCYARDERPLLESLYQRNDVRFLHRAANLEDVFVKLTGRELRDA